MAKKDEKQGQASFELIRDGFARARFGGILSGHSLPGTAAPFTFAPPEGQETGGLNPEEYTARWFRILSMAVTPYRYFDFTRPGVLQAAAPLFEGLTLYANHRADVNDWKGKCLGPVWDAKGTPPGINALLAVDKLVDPKMARGVETGALRSCSVTIWFEFERSHPDLRYFWDQIGTEVDGELVRLIVTKITNAGEVSIVWEGEDPFAKALEVEFSVLGKTEEGKETNEGGDEMKIQLSGKIAPLLALTAGTELSMEDFETKLHEMVTGLQGEVDRLKPEAALGAQLLKETREQAVAAYKVLKGEKFSQDFCDGVIGKADLKTARALLQEYQEEIDKKTPLTCEKCGGKVSRRSSQGADNAPAGDGKRVEDFKIG